MNRLKLIAQICKRRKAQNEVASHGLLPYGEEDIQEEINASGRRVTVAEDEPRSFKEEMIQEFFDSL